VVEAPERAPEAQGAATCPRCHARIEAGQIACLECGTRLGVAYRRPTGWRVPATLLALLVLLCGAGTGLALSRLLEDPERTITTTAAGASPSPVVSPAPPQTQPAPTPGQGRRPEPPPAGGAPGGVAAPGPAVDLEQWPADERAYTVVLSSSSDRIVAEREARAATARGVSDVGVIDGRRHANLEPDTFLVFAGRHDDLATAEENAEGYAGLGYGDAFPRLIEPLRR
jgi:hypothetical protein